LEFTNGIDHVCVVAKDLEKSIDFYSRIIGMKLTKRENIPATGVEIAIMTLGGENLELVHFTDGRDFHDGDGLIELIGFKVKDVFESAEYLKENGVELIGEPVRLGPNDALLFFRGPSGERLEIVQKD